jgi:hypothetical protein
MDLCLKIQLDSKQQRCILGLAIVVHWALDDVAGRPVEVGRGRHRPGPDVTRDLAATGSLAFTACIGHVAGGTCGFAEGKSVLSIVGVDLINVQGRHRLVLDYEKCAD